MILTYRKNVNLDTLAARTFDIEGDDAGSDPNELRHTRGNTWPQVE